jgi:hypothetical protein
MVILELIRAKTLDFLEEWHLLEQEPSVFDVNGE